MIMIKLCDFLPLKFNDSIPPVIAEKVNGKFDVLQQQY